MLECGAARSDSSAVGSQATDLHDENSSGTTNSGRSGANP
jgi:hypothetical protein